VRTTLATRYVRYLSVAKILDRRIQPLRADTDHT
ncbi:uncharacterized protein METZ01_LOCUS449530, partial [marine metagenome]